MMSGFYRNPHKIHGILKKVSNNFMLFCRQKIATGRKNTTTGLAEFTVGARGPET